MLDNQLLDNGQGVIDPDTYFETNSPPHNLAEFESKTTEFVDYHGERGTPVVLITVSRHSSNPLFMEPYLIPMTIVRVAELWYPWKTKQCAL